jgi:L-ascorbate metabolism protein UlaG (beta-lactamase superfamily)
MKVTRYPQSCIVIEKDGFSIVIDPGDPFVAKHKAEELKHVGAVFYTHDHFDHCNRALAAQLHEWGIPLFGNASVVALLQSTPCITVTPGEMITVGPFAVNPALMAHSDMVDGGPGPENTGYIIDNHLLHPGDSHHVDGVTVPVIALPIIGPDISPRTAYKMAQTVGATTAIAIHYDLFGANPEFYELNYERFTAPFKLTVLADGESVEV